MAWSIVATGTRVRDTVIPQLRGSLDVGFALPLPNASVWLRGAAGISGGDRDIASANFYFGGFGNNYVDSGSVKRYREYYALPGFELNSVAGQRFARATAEFNAPPVVFESVGVPGFHATWLRPSLFASGLWTSVTNGASAGQANKHSSFGAQADLRVSVFHWSEVTLSVGYAFGFESTRRKGNEFMISLKIL